MITCLEQIAPLLISCMVIVLSPSSVVCSEATMQQVCLTCYYNKQTWSMVFNACCLTCGWDLIHMHHSLASVCTDACVKYGNHHAIVISSHYSRSTWSFMYMQYLHMARLVQARPTQWEVLSPPVATHKALSPRSWTASLSASIAARMLSTL